MIAAINAERIKRFGRRTGASASSQLLGLGFGAARRHRRRFLRQSSRDRHPDRADFLLGVNQFGVAVLAIMSILGVTTEYRFGTIRPTFAAIPRRPQVLLAKAVVFGGLSFAVVAIVVVVAVVAAQVLADVGVSLTGPEVVRHLWGTPVFAMLCADRPRGGRVGAAFSGCGGDRCLVWMLALERIVSVLPRVGEHMCRSCRS